MPLAIAAISPHGFPLIPDLSPDAEGALRTRTALLELRRRFREADPEVIVIAGPHGIRVNDRIAVADVRRAAGTLHWRGRTVEMNLPVDMAFTRELVARARAAGLPIAEVGYGGADPRASVLPLDWGLMTPLWFAGHDRNLAGFGYVTANYDHGDPAPTGLPVVVVTPSRQIPRSLNVAFGRALAEAAEASPRRVAFVASGDWSHAHAAGSPYGYHPAAAAVDARVVAAIRDNAPLGLIDLDEGLIRDAVIDGLWQVLVLGGALEVVPLAVDLLSYEVPSYYGMLVATYRRGPA
ncbi:MAG TPA: aromatic ring-opening dioxygenase subunit LigB [Thermomicrobiales bacterium]|nr:aromatic ring-opening dioxygenase subunit LigB [Thermomicrobiales bacterium]